MKYADRVKETTTTTGTGQVSLDGGPSSGFQGFVAAGLTGANIPYAIVSGTAWEVGLGTITDLATDTLDRDTILASSNAGSVISLTGTSDVYNTLPGSLVSPQNLETFTGRLTTETGVYDSASDRTSQSTLYLTGPNGGNFRTWLYDGTKWKHFDNAEISLALTSLTTDTNYDVFLYDNSGTPNLELTAWTNDTTRATGLSTLNGVVIKSGTNTRRYVGTIRTKSTTTTEDSRDNRLVWNYYNRRMRGLRFLGGNNHTYDINTWRNWNNSSTESLLTCVVGEAQNMIGAASCRVFSGGGGAVQMMLNGSSITGTASYKAATTDHIFGDRHAVSFYALGYNTIILEERAYSGTVTLQSADMTAEWWG